MTIYFKDGTKHEPISNIDIYDDYISYCTKHPSDPNDFTIHEVHLSEVKTIKSGKTLLEAYEL